MLPEKRKDPRHQVSVGHWPAVEGLVTVDHVLQGHVNDGQDRQVSPAGPVAKCPGPQTLLLPAVGVGPRYR